MSKEDKTEMDKLITDTTKENIDRLIDKDDLLPTSTRSIIAEAEESISHVTDSDLDLPSDTSTSEDSWALA